MEVKPLSSVVNRWAATLFRVFFWKDYYIIYNHRLLLIIGLVFSRSLTDNAIVSALAWYLTSNGGNVGKSAIFTNAQGSLSSFSVVLVALAAYSFIGRFRTLFFVNVAYIGGLVFLWKSHPDNDNWVLVVTLFLLALGTSVDHMLEDAIVDFVHDIDTSHDRNKSRSISRARIWLRVTYVLSALIAILFVAPDAIGGVHSSWNSSFQICLITMGLSLIIFGVGHIRDLQACPKKIHKYYISRYLWRFSRQVSSINLDLEMGENEKNTPAIATLNLDIKQKEVNMNIFHKKGGMLVLKSLLKMFPMWGVFLVIPIISSTGNAFFFLQYNNLNTDNDIAVQVYSLVQDFSKFAIPFLYSWIRCFPKNVKIKIGVGMFCGVLSCICAWQLEIYRLKEVSILTDKDANTSISFLWLVPQFCLLGMMEGLTEDGLLKFYMLQIKEEYLQRYREEYIAFVMGIGKVQNIFLILILKKWFGDTVNDCQLDKYYFVLVCLGSFTFIIYCCIARFFYMDQELATDKEESDIENVFQDHLMEQVSDILQNQDLANDDQKQDNQDDSGNDDLKPDLQIIEQIRDIEQNQDVTEDDEKPLSI